MGRLEPYLEIMNQWGRGEIVCHEVSPGRRGTVVEAEIEYSTLAGITKYLAQLRGHFKNEDPHWVSSKLSQRVRRGTRPLLFAPATTETQRHVLRIDGIDYVDLAGNVHLERRGFLIHVEGKRSAGPATRTQEKAFRRAGAQVVYALLAKHDAVTWPYRPLAEACGVSLRTANYVVNGLRKEGFVAGRGKRRRLERRADLVARWVTAYGIELRPRLIIETYRARPRSRAELLQGLKAYFAGQEFPWAVTAGEAAYMLTHYYRGDRIVIYAPKELAGFERDLGCIPDRNGNLQLLRHFSPMIEFRPGRAKYPIAHPLLIYAELVADGSERSLEAAALLREQHLGDYINDS